MHRVTRWLILIVMICMGSAIAEEIKPETLDPAYNHARFAPIVAPESSDIVKPFRAYTTCFDGPDDDTGDGVPEWVAYELRAAPNRGPT